jgi:hypothetical protein
MTASMRWFLRAQGPKRVIDDFGAARQTFGRLCGPSFGAGPAQGIGPQRADDFGKAGDHFGKPRGFGRGNPLDGEPLRIDADIFQDEPNGFGAGQGFVITFQVMAFAQVSPHDDDAVGTFAEGVHHQVRMNHPGAHHPHRPHVGGVLQA